MRRLNCRPLLKFASGEGEFLDRFFDYSMEYQLIKLHARRILAPPSGHLRHPCPLFTTYDGKLGTVLPKPVIFPTAKVRCKSIKISEPNIYVCIYCDRSCIAVSNEEKEIEIVAQCAFK